MKRPSLRQFPILSSLMPHLIVAFCAVTRLAAQSPAAPQPNAPVTHMEVSSMSQSNGSAVVTVKLPSSSGSGQLQIHLNGKDVAQRFTDTDCVGATCKTATLTTSDGLNTTKNVITVDAGKAMTGRLRFDAQSSSSSQTPTGLRATSAASSKAVSSGIAVPFLPPTVTLKTRYNNGWNGLVDASNPWFYIGNQGYPNAQPVMCSSSSIYVVFVFNRQTLQPESVPNSIQSSTGVCFGDAGSLATYLYLVPSSQIVVVGTLAGKTPDASLNTTNIGGTNWGSNTSAAFYPSGYLAIGVGGATAGTAYENYYMNRPGYEAATSFANGMLQEDAYGNYNFQSSETYEFTVSPNDPAYLTPNNTSVVTLTARPGDTVKYYAITPPAGTNGYWLLTLSRYSTGANPYSCGIASTSSDGTTGYIPNCGKFYNTGNSDPGTAQAAYNALATDIGAMNPWQLAFLTTVGQAAYGNSNWDVAGFTSYGAAANGYTNFLHAIATLGGTPGLTESMYAPNSAYTLISTPGLGGALTGGAVESSTALAAQGQTGLVHGILQRNLNGLYQPQQTNQETAALFQAKGGLNSPEFKLTEVALQQPVEWPSSSTTTLLSNSGVTASSIPGQIAAYRYLSFVLLTNIYFPGMSYDAPHLDDLHYFFTGSLNTTINYHTYDVRSIVWPGAPNNYGPYVLPCNSVSSDGLTCTVTIGGAGDPLIFTQNDFLVVQRQMFNEIVYLTNTLQYMVTGSTNMKDVIAAGNANAGLALTGAAASILGSKLLPAPPATVVSTSWQNIVSMLGGIASLASVIPGYGELAGLTADMIKDLTSVATATGGIASIAAGAGQITSSSTSSSLPSSFAHFSTTIGELANGSMQGQLSAGFDTVTDSITSDWGRLSTIGPMVVDPNNSVFYAPNQVSQLIATQALTQAASRSFYLALLPSFYSVHYWQGVSGDRTNAANNIPDMGYNYNDPNTYWENFCSAFYLNPQKNGNPPENGDTPTGLGTITPNTSVWYPSPVGTPQNFQLDYSKYPIDYFVIGGTVANSGSDSPFIQTLDPTLGANLFTTSGLNMPIDQFVTQTGPMSSVWVNAATNNPAGHKSSSVCNARIYPTVEGAPTQPGYSSGVGAGTPSTIETPTTTVLTVPTTSVYGASVVLSAKVATSKSAVTSGQIYFQDNGTTIATVPLDNTGTASVTLALSVGAHSFQAKYGRVDPYATSSSAVSTLSVYGASPDLGLSLSSNTLTTLYGSTSQPITLQITSIAGLAGQVSLACSGLPIGMVCNFTPASMTLTENGIGSSSLTVTGIAPSKSTAGVWSNPWLAGLSALGMLSLSVCFRKRSVHACKLLLIGGVAVLGLGTLTGCGGTSHPSTQPTTVTALVVATSGNVSRTMPITVTVQ